MISYVIITLLKSSFRVYNIYIYIYIELSIIASTTVAEEKEGIELMMSSIKGFSSQISILEDKYKEQIRILSQNIIKKMHKINIPLETKLQSTQVISDLMQGIKYSQNASTQITDSLSARKMIQSMTRVFHLWQIPGEAERLITKSFEMAVGKEEPTALRGKVLVSESDQKIEFPIFGLKQSGDDMNNELNIISFEMVEYAVSPHMGQILQRSELGPILQLNLFNNNIINNNIDNDPERYIFPELPNNNTFELLLKSTKKGENVHCSYYDEQRGEYSTLGMKTNLVNINEDGNGLVKCSSNHLTLFALSQNPYDILADSNAEKLKHTENLEEYEIDTSPGTLYIIYI